MTPVLLLLLAAVLGGQAIKLQIPPAETSCIWETLDEEHFEVPGGARIDGRVMVTGNTKYHVPFIAIKLTGPEGTEMWSQKRTATEAHFNVRAHGPGTYKICFTNPQESRNEAVVDLVYFTLAHLRRAPGAAFTVPKGSGKSRSSEVAQKEHTESAKSIIQGLSEFMDVISGSQRYLQRRRQRHMYTMESNKRRTTWYALLELAVLLLVSGLQVFVITRFFKGGRITKISV